jgi:Cys-rich protein (TIGR01571 family)
MSVMAKATVYGTVPTTEQQRTVEVVAPADLPEHYSFYVWEAARPSTGLRVQVPSGGVHAGERFGAIVVDDVAGEGGPHAIPTGRWRDGLCDCCRYGCCHPQCCLTWWCRPCALGQVLTRFHLNWYGKSVYEQGRSAFFILFWLYFVYLVVSGSLSFVIGLFSPDEETAAEDEFGFGGGLSDLENVPAWVNALSTARDLLEMALFIFMLVVTIRMRRFLRDRYRIPERFCCIGCEDFCCAFWCMPCTICQMGRHTADYGTYHGRCCAEDGLADGVPAVV